MKEILSTISSKGQVTIPAEVRRHLGVGTKDRVAFVIQNDGGVKLEAPRYPNVSSLKGAAGSLKKPLSWQEMRAIAREDALEKKRSKEQ